MPSWCSPQVRYGAHTAAPLPNVALLNQCCTALGGSSALHASSFLSPVPAPVGGRLYLLDRWERRAQDRRVILCRIRE